MAYLFRFKMPKCAESSCHNYGNHEVRSPLLHDKERFPEVPKPLCLRHAKKLYAWFEAEEQAAQGREQEG